MGVVAFLSDVVMYQKSGNDPYSRGVSHQDFDLLQPQVKDGRRPVESEPCCPVQHYSVLGSHTI
jgi:hypothetical protein